MQHKQVTRFIMRALLFAVSLRGQKLCNLAPIMLSLLCSLSSQQIPATYRATLQLLSQDHSSLSAFIRDHFINGFFVQTFIFVTNGSATVAVFPVFL